ncbi:hypothetical protein [Mucisphaera calidilacus]|uniref:Sigma-70 family RNA polymerase sigma factor n=1 Tax=Mucisphaera calidilacus TaxID=2527982 RepID=A0A518C020_9BACT|nr:hypothetical protein [Mucisphaera calidilacus]QDU72565.1 hypothetical protein Pan265_24350 [Mucisphaera calidilacus]
MARRTTTTRADFPATQWTLIGEASGAGDRAREALNSLLANYLPALRSHLIFRKRFRSDEADELLQGFIADKVIERNLLSKADQARGKFRTLLLTALNNYVISVKRAEKAAKRQPGGSLRSIDDEGAEHLGAVEDAHVRTFEVEWARLVLNQTVERVREQCDSSQRPELWGILEMRILRPTLEGSEPTDYDTLVKQFQFKSPMQASNALITAKRMFVRQLREVISAYAQSEDEIDREIEELRDLLSGADPTDDSRIQS